MSNDKSPFLPSLASLLLGFVLLYGLSLPLLSGDLGWHINVGRYVLDHGQVPHTNYLCFTSPWSHWLTHEWLTDVLFALLDETGGLRALFLARGLLFFTTLLLLYRLGRKLGAEPLALAGLLLLTAVTLALNVALRPWILTNLFLVLELFVLEKMHREPMKYHTWWLFPFGFGLWANLHGGFAVGLGAFGLMLAVWTLRPLNRPPPGQATGMDESSAPDASQSSSPATAPLTSSIGKPPQPQPPSRTKRFLISIGLLLGFLFTLLPNPHGFETLILPIDYMFGETSTGLALIHEIKEWSPLRLNSFFGGIFLIWACLALLSLTASRSVRRRPELYIGILFLLFTFKAQRHLPLAALFLFPMVCKALLKPLVTRLDNPRRPAGIQGTGPLPASGATALPASGATAIPGSPDVPAHPASPVGPEDPPDHAGSARSARAFLAGLSRREAAHRGPFMATIVVGILVWFLVWSSSASFESSCMRAKHYPLAAVEALAERPPLRVFNHCDWAGLMAWKAPEWPLFITPVFDAHPRTILEDWLVIANLKSGWQARLDTYRVEAVFMPTHSALVTTLKRIDQWKVTYEDEEATLLVRGEK